jgi:hypothetical protein
MGNDYQGRRIPTQEILMEAAVKIFEFEAGLRVESGTWQYRALPEKGVAAAKFALSNGMSTRFDNVLIVARYSDSKPHMIQVQASVRGLSPMRRDFYVIDNALAPASQARASDPQDIQV